MRTVFFSNGLRYSCFCSLGGRLAFSLVEVVLALGVASFAILLILSLLPAGIQSTKDSLEESGAINVLSEIISDRQATPFSQTSTVYQLPALTSALTTPVSGFFGIKANNQYTASALTQAGYRVDYTIIPSLSGRLDPYRARLKVSWPASSPNPSGFVEVVATFPQP